MLLRSILPFEDLQAEGEASVLQQCCRGINENADFYKHRRKAAFEIGASRNFEYHMLKVVVNRSCTLSQFISLRKD